VRLLHLADTPETTMKSLLALAAAGALLLSAAPAAAQSVDRVVREQLEAAADMMRAEGYTQQGGIRAGALEDGEAESLTLELSGGHEYVIMGVCDADCSDLDLVLRDAGGSEVDSDYEVDDVPVVVAEVARNGSYRLTVSMAACSIEPCGYGVAVFAKRK
jgi:opacity protein-like surface antigen